MPKNLLTDAKIRATRDKARALVKQGIHPAHEQQLAHMESNKVWVTYKMG